MTDLDPGAMRAISRLIGECLDHLDVVARNPVQGMAMHKVIAAHLLEDLPGQGYRVVSETKWADIDTAAATCTCGAWPPHLPDKHPTLPPPTGETP